MLVKAGVQRTEGIGTGLQEVSSIQTEYGRHIRDMQCSASLRPDR